MANIYWNDKGQYWRAQVQIDGVVKNFKSRKPGTAGKREIQARIKQFTQQGTSDRTVNAEWLLFLDDVQARSSAANHRNMEQLGRLYVLPEIGNKRMSQLRITDLQRAINNSKKQDGTLLSKKMYSNIKGAISNFIHFARLDGVTELMTTDLYVPKNSVKGTKNILTPEQIKRIFTDFEDEFYSNLWKFLLCTGARPGEALGLKWSDYNGTSIVIQRSINYQHEVTDCKNDNARRVLPANSLVSEILENQREKTAYLNSDWIFPSPSGDMPYQSTTQHSIKRISDALGTPISAYGLRHCFVSLMASINMPEAYLKQIIGHSSKMPTYDGTYSHPINGDKEKASVIIDDTLRKIL